MVNHRGINKPPKVLVVCMGNICRSPTGEAVLRAKAKQLQLDVIIDSAGTLSYHQGNSPDKRSQQAASQRGYCFAGIKARQVVASDFVEFDYILAADRANLADLLGICPAEQQHKLSLFLSHRRGVDDSYTEVPDPYYGGEQGFELVLDLIEQASDGFLQQLQRGQ